MRCFIAIDLDSNVKANIKEFIQQENLNQIFKGIRWVKPDNFHITLAFLGEITTNQASTVKNILEGIIRNTNHLSLKCQMLDSSRIEEIQGCFGLV